MPTDPIIHIDGNPRAMGRIRPGTILAIRETTAEERGARIERLEQIGCADIPPERWFVCWADDPTQVLFDWFSPRGGQTDREALAQALTYARGRGALIAGHGARLLEIDYRVASAELELASYARARYAIRKTVESGAWWPDEDSVYQRLQEHVVALREPYETAKRNRELISL